MRFTILYGSILLFCLVIATVRADIRWKYDYENSGNKNRKNANNGEGKNKNAKYSQNQATYADNGSDEEMKPAGKSYQKKNKGKIMKQPIEESSSEEDNIIKTNKDTKNQGEQQGPKRFIGRIEHGKVKVLRRKEDSPQNGESDEDYKQEVCRKSKSGKKLDCNGSYNGNGEEIGDSSEENGKPQNKPAKKIKYSIKFQHEKQKKKEKNGDITIMRLHKNGKKRYGKDDDDDSSEEDDSPIKRIHFMDDDD